VAGVGWHDMERKRKRKRKRKREDGKG